MLRVSIIGCGWLGFPLAQTLVHKGHKVKGTTTTLSKLEMLKKCSVEAFEYRAELQRLPEDILQADVLVLAFPPKTKTTDGSWYLTSIKGIVSEAKRAGIRKLVMISSTSVYPDIEGVVDEASGIEESNTGSLAIYFAEKEVLKSGIPGYVLRMAGLAGGDRLLAKHFSGKADLPNGNTPVNLIHKSDAVSVIAFFIEHDVLPGIYNVCSPIHPLRKELYLHDCVRFGLALPSFLNEGGGKIISSKKLVQTIGYRFNYDDPRTFDYTIS